MEPRTIQKGSIELFAHGTFPQVGFVAFGFLRLRLERKCLGPPFDVNWVYTVQLPKKCSTNGPTPSPPHPNATRKSNKKLKGWPTGRLFQFIFTPHTSPQRFAEPKPCPRAGPDSASPARRHFGGDDAEELRPQLLRGRHSSCLTQ